MFGVTSMKKQELIDFVNTRKFYWLPDFEISEELNENVCRLLVSTQDYIFEDWYCIATNVYKCEDGFVGVTGIDNLSAGTCEPAEEFDVVCHAEEYSEVPSVKYVKSK